MKLVVLALGLVAVTLAVPVPDKVDGEAQIVRSEFDQKPEGGYSYTYETDNGISRAETGEVKEVVNEENKPQSVVIVRGSYTYKDAEGKPNTVTYFADETGYHAEGDSIPKA